MILPKIALGAWSWGVGAAGGDQVFGNHLSAEELKPVFDKAMEYGLNLWDTAAVYGEGTSERILGNFVKDVDRKDVILSTKFTPQIAGDSPSAMQEMIDGSKKRLHTDVVDIYWIHNPMDVERWTPDLIPLAKSGQIKEIGVSNHNLADTLEYISACFTVPRSGRAFLITVRKTALLFMLIWYWNRGRLLEGIMKRIHSRQGLDVGNLIIHT